MFSRGLLVLLAASRALASPVRRAVAPTVTITDGTVIGSSLLSVDSFKGIPFAQPPVGPLRLKPPQPITKSFGTITAVGEPMSCPQMTTSINVSALTTDGLNYLSDTPFYQELTGGEDCLTINVQRPTGTTATSKLPVVVWIFGGGFEFGSTQTYDGSSLILKSVSLGKPVLYVAMNYRVSGFGFLAGSDLAAEGSTNLGLRDQRLALQWVQDNIAAFGGDPTKVTIWGESAGSISVFDHTVINGGDNTYNGKPLFRGAIMDSGSITPADVVTGVKAQSIYDAVVAAAGCASASSKLTCLRALDYATFLNAVNSVPGIFSYRSLDLSYLPRPDPGNNFFSVSPEVSVANGAFAKVPIIIGDQEDEGTLFSLVLNNITTNADLINYLTTYFPQNANAKSLVTELVNLYPNDLGQAGSPFNTGVANNIYPQYKRVAAILGDIAFTLTRRLYLHDVSSKVPSWSYLSSYFYGLPVLGTFHATDILEAYDLLGPNIPTESIQAYYVSFINDLNPNSLGTTAPLINWPEWTTSSPNLLNFQAAANVIIPDTFREAAYTFIQNNPTQLRV